jgi:hypothetical protein
MSKLKKIIIQTFVNSLIFFTILFIISSEDLFTNRYGFNLEPINVFIALIPLVIWLIVSGKLKELKGPGGIGIIMRDEGQKSISPEITKIALKVDPAVVEKKGGLDELRYKILHNPPTTLSFEIEKKNYYNLEAIKDYIYELEKNPDFRYILFNDADGKFKGIMKVNYFKYLLETDDLVQRIENSKILEDSRVTRKCIKITSTNKQALNEMEKVNVNMLPVVDRRGRFIGVVTQEEILRRILTKILQEA